PPCSCHVLPRYVVPRVLLSFPTRRSSDLVFGTIRVGRRPDLRHDLGGIDSLDPGTAVLVVERKPLRVLGDPAVIGTRHRVQVPRKASKSNHARSEVLSWPGHPMSPE